MKDSPDFCRRARPGWASCRLTRAIWVRHLIPFKNAWEITPSSITRSAKLGAISF